MNFDTEVLNYNVSRETLQKLHDFMQLLKEWNNKMNLVSHKAIDELEVRHVLDSLQLTVYLPENISSYVDVGSGSGFPGVIVAIWLREKMPNAKVCLIESITKKASYLQDVCSRLGLANVSVYNGRAENAVFKGVDVVTARAVANLDSLCGFVEKLCSSHTQLLFLKGKAYPEELTEAQKHWSFKHDAFPNKYSSDGVVLKLSNLRKKK